MGQRHYLVDVGIAFPDEDMPGVDLIIPDFSWLKNQKIEFEQFS